MYYTEIKHYLRLKEQRDDVKDVYLVVIGAVLIVLMLMSV